MTQALDQYRYLYQEGSNQRLIVLLHGTGGSERDLIPVAQQIDPKASLLAVRGDVDENGSLRFFKRKGMGQYDLEDLDLRGRALADFIQAFAQQAGFSHDQVILLGFSNGANIALHMVLQGLLTVRAAFFLAPLYPLEALPGLSLTDFDAFVSMGREDPICSLDQSHHVLNLLDATGAEVTPYWVRSHQITQDLLAAAHDWLDQLS